MELIQQIQENAIVAVIRGAKPSDMLKIATALREGGVKTLEITVDTPKVMTLIEEVSTELDQEVIVGAGTVLDAETARMAILSGAKFIFSPTVNVDLIKLTKRYGAVSIPGALTPTEILKGYENGGDIIKVFPANAFGPAYIKDIKAPLPQIPLMPTGGVNLENIGEYMKHGAVAAGVGSTLVNTRGDLTKERLREITETARQMLARVKQARSSLN
ncbi:bifunctional 4-hydroxy-2-oxoglutarate aldolase/2-dehydro-3-deoxy-phosphogluconate aldolase [Halalkalibacter okhensis]|uniref:2-dehydro-3-deoxyphosphogluconate aldolase n=1 Tax=Halalkalibacter okhensis TaxID=333138 RepID=A0A0B0IAI5_9BACI|nr:bifunctional 4-hydroxy-2-oxoglutarate aldolase/2-dehydro-3-deoxy-phosphogluconate aldolase [Halalkalibacter okhensis]KHF39578.1 2-dehydro-3-deoxyphosphogluconate aldolase [Halalkalibacter okhensis]